MTQSTDTELLVRVRRLEREMRAWRAAASVLLLSVLLALLTGQASTAPTVVEAQRFILRGPDNKVRAVLGTGWPGLKLRTIGGGEYGLHFYDADGQYRAGISEVEVESGGWQLQLQGKRTPSSARLLVGDGLAAVTLHGTEQTREVADTESAERNRRAEAAKTLEERVKLRMAFDGVSAALSAFPKGTSSLTLKHGLGGGLDFYLHQRQSSFYLMDENGTTRAALGHTKLEYPATGVAEERPLSSLVLFDKAAKVVWKAP